MSREVLENDAGVGKTGKSPCDQACAMYLVVFLDLVYLSECFIWFYYDPLAWLLICVYGN